MLLAFKNGITSVILRVKILDTSQAYPKGLTGLTNSSTGLNISTIADNESSATAYTSAGSTIDTITTLGTFATPTAGHCEFKEVDSTNHPGVYEIQIANARYAVSSARSLLVTVLGPTNAAQTDAVIQLWGGLDPQDGVHGGLSCLPNTAITTNASLLTSGTGTDQLSVTSGRIDIGKALGTSVTLDANNVLNVSAKYWAGTAISAASIPVATAAGAAGGLLLAGANAATTFATLTSTGAFTVNGVSAVSQTGDAYARLGAPAGASVSADVAAVKSDTGTIKTATNTGAAPGASGGLLISGSNSGTTTLGAFTVTGAMSINGTGNVAQTGDSYGRIGAPAGASVSADVAAVKSDTAATKTQATLARQAGINRRETSPVSGIQTLYADDGTTPLKTGNIWLDVGGTQPYDGTGPINRQDGLS